MLQEQTCRGACTLRFCGRNAPAHADAAKSGQFEEQLWPQGNAIGSLHGSNMALIFARTEVRRRRKHVAANFPVQPAALVQSKALCF